MHSSYFIFKAQLGECVDNRTLGSIVRVSTYPLVKSHRRRLDLPSYLIPFIPLNPLSVVGIGRVLATLLLLYYLTFAWFFLHSLYFDFEEIA